MLCGLTSHNVNTWNAALGAVLHTHLSALIASLRLKRVGLTYAGRPGGTHVSGQGKAQQMTPGRGTKDWRSISPWSKNRRQITGSRKRRAQKPGRPSDRGKPLADIYCCPACRAFATVRKSFASRCKWRQQLSPEKPLPSHCLSAVKPIGQNNQPFSSYSTSTSFLSKNSLI